MTRPFLSAGRKNLTISPAQNQWRILPLLHCDEPKSFASSDTASSDTASSSRGKLPSKATIAEDDDEEEAIRSQYGLAPGGSMTRIPDRLPLKLGQRLVAIGDVHGDLGKLKASLEVAGVARFDDDDGDDNNQNDHEGAQEWIGGDSICVQIGDIFDRGDKELSCLSLLSRLSHQAQQDGGVLSVLFGNHEALNAEGHFDYVTEGGFAEFETKLANAPTSVSRLVSPLDGDDTDDRKRTARWGALVHPKSPLRKVAFANMKVALIVGRSVLVHGGLVPKHLSHYKNENCCDHDDPLGAMNREAQEWFLKQGASSNNNTYDEEKSPTSPVLPLCLGPKSPLWTRLYSYPPDAAPQDDSFASEMIDLVLAELDVDRMIMGHTPQKEINAALLNKAWRIDVRASSGVNDRPPEVLEIVMGEEGKEEVWVLTHDGNRIPASRRQTVSPFFHGEW